jgi:hypothetical protein
VLKPRADQNEQLESEYSQRAVTAHRESIQADFINVSHMKIDPALDPPRDRDDFQALMMDLVMPTQPFTH